MFMLVGVASPWEDEFFVSIIPQCNELPFENGKFIAQSIIITELVGCQIRLFSISGYVMRITGIPDQ